MVNYNTIQKPDNNDHMLIYYIYTYLIKYLNRPNTTNTPNTTNKINTKLWETEINIPITKYSLIHTFIDPLISKYIFKLNNKS
jgi:hypothetical protein